MARVALIEPQQASPDVQETFEKVLRGKPGYEWTVNHVLPLSDPLELISVKLETVGR